MGWDGDLPKTLPGRKRLVVLFHTTPSVHRTFLGICPVFVEHQQALEVGLRSRMHSRYERKDVCGMTSRVHSAAPQMPNAPEVSISALLWTFLAKQGLEGLEMQLPAVVELLKRLS